jgi:hypothetical protein
MVLPGKRGVQFRLLEEVSGNKTAKESTAKKIDASKFFDDEAEDDHSVDPPEPETSTETSSHKKETAYKDFTQAEPRDNENDATHDADEDDMFQTHNDHLDIEPSDAYPATSFTTLQPAFAPSSTLIKETRRILCWNHVELSPRS